MRGFRGIMRPVSALDLRSPGRLCLRHEDGAANDRFVLFTGEEEGTRRLVCLHEATSIGYGHHLAETWCWMKGRGR